MSGVLKTAFGRASRAVRVVALGFAVLLAPVAAQAQTITGLSVTEGLSSATQTPTNVTISGSGFSGSANQVFFGGVPAGIISESATSITVTPPARGGGGLVDVAVTTAGNSTATWVNGYRYLLPPTVSIAFSPSTVNGAVATRMTATISNPNPVQLRGTGLVGATRPAAFSPVPSSFGGDCGGSFSGANFAMSGIWLAANASCTKSFEYQVITSGSYTYTTGTVYSDSTSTHPTAGSVSLTGGTATTGTLVANAVPTISSLSPNAGPVAGGQSLTLTGTNFLNATDVTFDGASASFSVNSNTSITAVTPANAAGLVAVFVTGPGGTSSSRTYTYVTASTANAQSVSTAYNTAVAVALTGSGTGPLSYTVTTLPTNGTLSGSGANLTYTPTAGFSGADTFQFTTTNAGGTSAPATVTVTVAAGPPAISAISPAEGAADASAPPATVTITGTNFSATGNAVTFAGTPGTVVSESATSITVIPPARSAGGLVNVVVTNANSQAGTAANAYRYLLPPVVTVTWSPDTITGNQNTTFTLSVTNPNSIALTNVRVASNGANTPFYLTAFGGTCGSGTYNASSAFNLTGFSLAANATCTTNPTQATSSAGAFQFVTNAPTSTGTATTNVTLTGVPATSNTITAYQTPFISTVTPANGPLAGGTSVTITGQNFYGATAVTIDGVAATNVTVVSNTSITATVPPGGSAGAKSVAVTTPAATSTRANAFSYNPLPAAPLIGTPGANAATLMRPAYSGTVSGSGQTVTVYVDGASIGTTTSTGTSWSLLQPTDLAGGSHTVYATATTVSGGTSAASATTTFTVDTAAPAAPVITSHTEGDFRATRDAFIAGTAEPDSVITVTGSYPQTLTANGSGNWGYLAPAVGADGPVSISVTATDAAGNVSTATTRGWTVDTVAPASPVFTTPSEGQVVNQRSLAIEGTIEPYAHVNILLDGQPVAGFVTGAAGTFSYTVTNMADGSHTLSARAADRAGNNGAYSASRNFTVDATAPAFPTLTSPTPGSTIANATPTLSGEAETGAVVTLYLNDNFLAQVTAVGGVWSHAVTTPLADADYQVKLMALDTAFNSSGLSPAIPFRVDGTAPAAPVILSPSNGSLTASGLVTVQGTAEAGSTVSVIIDGDLADSVTATNGVWTSTPTLLDGVHTISATSKDAANNVSVASATVTVTVDATAPAQPTITSPTQNQSVNVARPTLTGTAESGSTVTLTINGTAFTTTATAGAWSYTPTSDLPAGQNMVLVTATDAAGNMSPQALVSFNFVPITITTTSLPSGQVGVTYAATIEVQGGSAPYTFDRIGGSLPIGLQLDRNTGVFSGEAGESGSFPIEIMVADANNVMTSQAYTIEIAVPAPPVADPETVDVPATSATGPTTVDLSGSVNNAIAIEIVSQPSVGSVAVNGLSVIYTPQPGFFGTVTFQYKAVGFNDGDTSGAESAPATVTITIAAPTLVLSGGALPAGQIAQAYSETVAASGGTAPYTYAVTAGALPAGLTLATDGTLSGSATAGGVFNFDVTATDSSTGTGPFSITSAYSLSIDAPTMSVTPGAAPSATVAQAYSTAFTGSGGVAPYSYAVTAGALPAGLTLATDGILSGTPTAGGAFSFTVTATDSSTGAGPYTASQTVALTVNGSTIAVAPTALTDGVRGVAYSQSVTAAGGVAPYTYTIASGALPAGLTLSPQGVIAGTPTVTGSFTFNVRATDSATGAGPYQGVATVTLTVSAAAITVTPTTLPEVLAGTAFSQQMQAAGGQGGYTYAVTSGGLPTGLTLTSGGLLSGRPQISGVFNFTITARDAFGNTGVAALALTVNGRPDPSADADVRGLSQAQGEAARRMAETQIDNFHRRLEALHSAAGDRPVDLNLNLDGGAFSPLDQSQVVNSELAQATGQYGLGQDRDLAGRQELARMMDARRPEASVSTAVPGPANGSVQTGGLRVWAGGAISLGERDAIDQTAELRIHTSGVSAGVDMRITDTLDLGLGAGFGQERTEVGEADSQMDADSWVGVAYGSWRPAEHIFFDGLLGYGEMSFDLRRRTPVDDSLVTGDRDGSTWFGSISAGVDRTFGPTRWIGYGRLEKQAATLDAYAETGSAVWALSYDARDLDSLQGALGVRYERLFDRRDYSLTPGMRVEWRKEFSEGGAQSLRYADWLDGPAYAIGQEGWGRSELNLGFSLDWKGADGWSVTGSTDSRFSDDQWLASMKLLISKVF